MDYRAWTDRDDWTKFNEPPLKEIDQAVEWGGKYGIHVLINFHRTPGYTVASPPEAKSLWTDAEAQRVCALHWAMFARRYKGVPNERLSFNLFNEPANIEPAVYWDALSARQVRPVGRGPAAARCRASVCQQRFDARPRGGGLLASRTRGQGRW